MKLGLFFFCFCLIVACNETATDYKFSTKNLGSSIDTLINKRNFNGVILITQGKKTLYSTTKGFSDLVAQTPLALEDQFVIGSVSKQITAVLVLQAFEQGKLQLEDNLHTFLPKIEQSWAKTVTVHHLLTHTHGITAIEAPLAFEQGSKFQYSQLGYHLLAQILETIYGESFQKLVTKLFDKNKLKHSYHPNNKTYKQLVKGYEQVENGELLFTEHSLRNYAAAGSFISTAQDLNQWNQLLHKGKLVKKETLELMKTKYATRSHPIFSTIDYGYGLLFQDGEQEEIQVGALGYAPGFVTACYYYPAVDVSLVILENTARHLNDFRKTFEVHTLIMEDIKLRIQ